LALYAVAIAVLSFILWGFWWEPSSLTVVHRTIEISPWHQEHAGLRIALISDLHVGAPYRGLPALKHVVSVTNAERPDLIILLGDYVINGVPGGQFINPEPIADELANLHAPLGVVAVLGNHDWWYDGFRVRRALESHGIRVLENEVVSIEYRQHRFWIGGLSDFWTRGNGVAPTLSQVQDNEPILLVMHNPDVFPSIPERVSLTLAGHTHGGQVKLPIFGRPKVPSKFGQRYAYGLIEESGRKLFVTGGVGTSIIPVRFGVPPEVVILQLNPRSTSAAPIQNHSENVR
jgi:predicted MPP superfamily phosphohydrolase